MFSVLQPFQPLLIVYAVYLIATLSPGPSNLAIMGVAISQGRRSALVLAGGVVTGSMFWAVLAATGISTVLAAYAHALDAIKIVGGLYLLYLAVKTARSAVRTAPAQSDAVKTGPLPFGTLYRRGLMLHLANPKAVLAWIAIMSLGLKAEAPTLTALAIIVGCAGLGVLVFGGYALLFSSRPMVRLYRRARVWIEAVLALFFGFAGLRLLMSRA